MSAIRARYILQNETQQQQQKTQIYFSLYKKLSSGVHNKILKQNSRSF